MLWALLAQDVATAVASGPTGWLQLAGTLSSCGALVWFMYVTTTTTLPEHLKRIEAMQAANLEAQRQDRAGFEALLTKVVDRFDTILQRNESRLIDELKELRDYFRGHKPGG